MASSGKQRATRRKRRPLPKSKHDARTHRGGRREAFRAKTPAVRIEPHRGRRGTSADYSQHSISTKFAASSGAPPKTLRNRSCQVVQQHCVKHFSASLARRCTKAVTLITVYCQPRQCQGFFSFHLPVRIAEFLRRHRSCARDPYLVMCTQPVRDGLNMPLTAGCSAANVMAEVLLCFELARDPLVYPCRDEDFYSARPQCAE